MAINTSMRPYTYFFRKKNHNEILNDLVFSLATDYVRLEHLSVLSGQMRPLRTVCIYNDDTSALGTWFMCVPCADCLDISLTGPGGMHVHDARW